MKDMKLVSLDELMVGRDYRIKDLERTVLRFIKREDASVYFERRSGSDFLAGSDMLIKFDEKWGFDIYEHPLKLGKYEGVVTQSTKNHLWYFKPDSEQTATYFLEKGIYATRYVLQVECLGSSLTQGEFPYCKSEADVIKFINFLNDQYPEVEEIEQKSESGIKPKLITPAQAQMIIKKACATWKTKLASEWGINIALDNDVEIPESLYQEMRKACTAEQHKLFDEIFGAECEFKKGERLIVWNDDNCTSKEFRIRNFSHMKDGKCYCFITADQRIGSPTSPWHNVMSIQHLNLPK